jgi:hypothetical protein
LEQGRNLDADKPADDQANGNIDGQGELAIDPEEATIHQQHADFCEREGGRIDQFECVKCLEIFLTMIRDEFEVSAHAIFDS